MEGFESKICENGSDEGFVNSNTGGSTQAMRIEYKVSVCSKIWPCFLHGRRKFEIEADVHFDSKLSSRK